MNAMNECIGFKDIFLINGICMKYRNWFIFYSSVFCVFQTLCFLNLCFCGSHGCCLAAGVGSGRKVRFCTVCLTCVSVSVQWNII